MDTRSVSMARLLTDIRQHPSALCRETYLRHFPAHLQEMADAQFSRFAVIGAPHIDPEVPRRDLEQLKQSAERVGRFVNKRVAHTDLDGESASATYGDLKSCIDLLEKLTVQYHNLLTGECVDLLPTILTPWKNVFREPWIAPRESGARMAPRSDATTGPGDEQDG
jgi:hypothetical protein